MKDCKKTQRNLVAFLYGECCASDRKKVEAHLEKCQKCKQEFLELMEVYKAADSLNADMERVSESVDWENLPSHIAGAVFDKEQTRDRRQRRVDLWPFLLQPRFKPAYAGLLLGIMLGAIVTFLILRPFSLRVSSETRIIAPQGFYDRMELEIARRETIDYLQRSEYLLLDFVQSPPEQSAEFWQSEYASQKARDLLSKKKYIDPQLDKIKLAKAKLICDQIELLFFELIQISEELSVKDLENIKHLIRERQILLKIKLVSKELQKSEV